MNQADSDVIRGVLESHGVKMANSLTEADAVFINSCAVKGATEQKILYRAREIAKAGKPLVFGGCIPSANPELVRKNLPKAVLVGPSSLSHSFEAVKAALEGKKAEFFAESEEKYQLPRKRGSVIARVQINEGCTSACSFCQTRLARGRLHSYPLEEIVSEVRLCLEKGAKEIQVTSQDTGAYGLEIGTDVCELVDSITRLPGDFMVRVGMMNPDHAKRLLPKLIRMLENKKVYAFAHLPVQSGSNKVLKDMRRAHSVEDLVDVVNALREAIPGVTISTDVIVGYPTESEDDFKQTLQLLEEMRFDIVNVSKFTPRPFTPAAELKELDNKLVKKRSEITSRLVRGITAEKNRELVGKTFRVLVTEKRKNGFSGRTDSYKQVALPNQELELGKWVKAVVKEASGASLIAEASGRRL